MRYFLIGQAERLIELPDFQLRRGEANVERVTTMGGIFYHQGRKSPDRFQFSPPKSPPVHLSHFRVVDDSATVYECMAENLRGSGRNPGIVTGIVLDEFVPDHKEDAMRAVQQALREHDAGTMRPDDSHGSLTA